MADAWALRGSVLIACNCDWGCPCNFNALPSKGHCEGGWTWHVERGQFGGITLDGLNFSIFVKWPGAIHQGNGEGVFLVDERANAEQRKAIDTLTGGKVGGPWGVLGWTWPKLHGPVAVPYDIHIDGVHSHMICGSHVQLEFEPIRNPVNKHESHPSIVLPQGIVVKQGALAASKRFVIDSGISFDHSGQYTAVGPFEYSG